MNLLLLSNSRTANGFLVDHLPAINALAGTRRKAVFVPFAAVSMPWEDYAGRVREALAPAGYVVSPLLQASDLAGAELVVVGGGNTFQLLQQVRARGLLAPIASRVRAGVPYVGWSAGANLACPTIKTTNDMPIVDPGGLDALGLVGFQINPHYTNVHPDGHQGETRDQRLAEFALANPRLPVIGLPEGDWLRVRNDAGDTSAATVELCGPRDAVFFLGPRPPVTVPPGLVSF